MYNVHVLHLMIPYPRKGTIHCVTVTSHVKGMYRTRPLCSFMKTVTEYGANISLLIVLAVSVAKGTIDK